MQEDISMSKEQSQIEHDGVAMSDNSSGLHTWGVGPGGLDGLILRGRASAPLLALNSDLALAGGLLRATPAFRFEPRRARDTRVAVLADDPEARTAGSAPI